MLSILYVVGSGEKSVFIERDNPWDVVVEIANCETLLTRLLKTGGYHVFATKVIYMNEKRTSFEENLPLYLYDKRPLYERETPLSMIKRLLEPYI